MVFDLVGWGAPLQPTNCTAILPLPLLLLLLSCVCCCPQGAAASEPKGRKLSARQRKQRNYAAMGYGDEYEDDYR